MELAPFLDLPFAIFGHSFGARLAYELTLRLQQSSSPCPVHVFISGCRSPHQPHRQPWLHQLPPGAFEARVIADNEHLSRIANIDKFIYLMEPMLRAEIGMAERWGGQNRPALDVPLSILSGRDDDIATPAKMSDWHLYTRRDCTFATFPGDHFFLHSCEFSLLTHIAQTLSVHLERPVHDSQH